MRRSIVLLALLPGACATSSPPPAPPPPVTVDVPSAPPAPPVAVSPAAAAPSAAAAPGAQRTGDTSTPDGAAKRGRLTSAQVQQVVRAGFGQLRSCYERGLLKDPNLTGKVMIRFAIARDGSVSEAGDAGSDLPDREVVGCVLKSVFSLKFPEPEGGGIVTVVYPIVFAPAGPAPPGPTPAGAAAASPPPAAPSPAGQP
ncbi:AgmX/PglI C-terminal domain-containing protein [Sorangium sp. So ce321]|uniref:AgmX/PglI C-terminal domain-containing protein n=1 Tax=Sorangium sp. So ce321 TaxID=3133300 RepID=UPI003F640CA0